MNQDKKCLLSDHGGSALLSVIIAMLFLLALGLTLLLVSYTSLSVADSQKTEKETFYHAESALEDIRLGLQSLLSNAVAPAYTQALGKKPAGDQAQALFNRLLAQELLSQKVNGKAYFSGGQELSGYSAEVLSSLIRPESRDSVTLTGEGTIRPIYGESAVLQAVVLEGLSLVYLKNGYETQLTTDVRITMPSFNAAATATTPGLGNYAVIAGGKLRNRLYSDEILTGLFLSNNCTVSGSVFADQGISLSGDLLTLTEYSLTVKDGGLVSRGPISVADISKLTWNGGEQELWAESLRLTGAPSILGRTTSASLDGKVYLSGDLAVDGPNTAVTLKNSFFGFGSDRENPEKSSAILVSGSNLYNVSLDFSGLNSLYLGGTSFLDFTEAQLYDLGDNTLFTKPLIMGQSAALPANAQNYYVPPVAVKNYQISSYPFTLRATGEGQTTDTNGPDSHLPVIDYETVLWQRDGQDKRLSDYIGGDKGQVKMLYRTDLFGYKQVSLYLDFADEKAANTYFQDYFSVNLAQYNRTEQDKLPEAADVKLKLPADTASVFAAGNLPHTPLRQEPVPAPEPGKKWSDWALLPAAEQVYTEDVQAQYDSLVSPYALYIDSEKLNKLPSGRTYDFKNSKGSVVARLTTSSSYTLTSLAPSSLRLVIAKENLVVTSNFVSSSNFTGLLIAGGDIALRSNVTSTPLTPEMAEARCSELPNYQLGDFIKNNAQLLGVRQEAWDLNQLVTFENWTKN